MTYSARPLTWEDELESAVAERSTYDVADVWKRAVEEVSQGPELEMRLNQLWTATSQGTRGWSSDKKQDLWTRMKGLPEVRGALLSTPETREQLVTWWQEYFDQVPEQTIQSWCRTHGKVESSMSITTMEVTFRHYIPGAILYSHVVQRWPEVEPEHGWLTRLVDYNVEYWKQCEQATSLRPQILDLLVQLLEKEGLVMPWASKKLEDWWQTNYIDQEFLETMPSEALERLAKIVPDGSEAAVATWQLSLERTAGQALTRHETAITRKM